ncbi:DUF6514 family protein [Pseudoflavonifractor phocaeensis]|uniref:DUF6514 family protein n=1 Tax=Pseudoflavonifractor phocaeensis TaxID=1870988 RepID=UPI001F19D4A1|nr:DUF6514 family protein [Pseudoflavonifractor phocaeensis]MCF2596404.1 hypothetical protein [Pseudoflavonifractor phocaeensis]MDY3905481.1 DUF6514 family protein [Lawsonibacter sp.]
MEIKIATRQCEDARGRARRFHYYLTVDLVETDRFCCEDYGVRITEDRGESAAVPSITTSAMRIDELMTMLVEHQVGPAGLADVVADWL